MANPPELWRIFCALEFPSEVTVRAGEHIKRLRAEFPDVKASWASEGKFHLTLKFIGAIPRTRVTRVSQAAARAATNLSVFNLVIEGAGVFPAKGTPQVLWLGIIDGSGDLGRLHFRLETECESEGFNKEQRAFHPHLTLARLRQSEGARAFAKAHLEERFPAMQVQVAELLVMRSALSSAGSRYTVISRHPLGERFNSPIETFR